MYTLTSSVFGTGSESPESVLAKNPQAHNKPYLREMLYRSFDLALALGFNWDIIVGKCAEETATEDGPFTSEEWDAGNPAGMGVVTGGSHQDVPNFGVSGTRTAEILLTHFCAYYLGFCPDWFDPYREYNPRWQHVERAGLLGSIKTIQDFGNGRWADNPGDAANILRELKRLGANPKGTPVTNVSMYIDQMLTSRDLGFMDGGVNLQAWMTIHGNGNDNSMRYNEAGFVQGGGGTDGVLYHGAIDAGGMVQIEKMDRRGVHAGNSIGNAISIAFETCQGSRPIDTLRENVAQTIAAVLLGDARIDYGRLSPQNFSLERVAEHRDWGRKVGQGAGLANPACPAIWISQDGPEGIDARILPRAKQLIGNLPDQPGYALRRPTPAWDGNDHTKYGVKWYALRRMVQATKKTPRLQAFGKNSPEVGEPLAKGEKFMVDWYVRNAQGNDYWVTGIGTVVIANDVTPNLDLTEVK